MFVLHMNPRGRRWLISLVLALFWTLLAAGDPILAAGESCDALIDELRLSTSEQTCRWINDNWACYGSTQAAAEPATLRFNRPRDRQLVVVMNEVETFSQIGAVLMRLRASQQDPIKLIVFGDSTLTPLGGSSFTLTADGAALLCEDTPSGMVVRTEEGESGRITVNGVDIELGSSAFVSTEGGGQAGLIVYYGNADGNWNIYVMDGDGGNVRQLTRHSAADLHPTWSPDGQTIAFQSDRDGDFEIYLMDRDGANVRQLTRNTASDRHPAWSPTNPQIAFDSDRDGDYEIYVMDQDGRNLRQLTRNSTHDRWPVWSPDGTRIAFYSNRDGDYEIYLMDADGRNVQQLTFNSADDRYPAWSPDGSQIAFSSDRDGDWEIYVMDADGRNVRQLTRNSGTVDWGPTWLADGTQIGFTSNRHGNNEIYVMGVDGSNVRRLTDNSSDDELPVWKSAPAMARPETMTVANLEGRVAVAIGQTRATRVTQTVPVGRQVEITLVGGRPTAIGVPVLAPPFRSPLLTWLATADDGLQQVDDPSRTAPCGGAIEYGATVFEQISLLGQECLYTFEGSQGDRVTVEMSAQSPLRTTFSSASAPLDTWLDLLDGVGELVASNDDDAARNTRNSAIRDVLLPGSGLYTIVARSYLNDSVGPFELTLTAVPASSSADLVVASLTAAGSIGRDSSGNFLVPVRVVVTNQGSGTAPIFKVDMHYFSADPDFSAGFLMVPFTVPGQSDIWTPFTPSPLAPGRSVTFTGSVLLSSRLAGTQVELRATADSCAAEEFTESYCRVDESDEENNESSLLSVSLPTTPVVR